MEYVVNPAYDTDLVELDGEELHLALLQFCACGHRRDEHYGASGSIASFGGSACKVCWVCPTFRPVAHPNA